MPVTIADALHLPALHGASLLTDASGLDHTITAVSVLEYSDVTDTQQDLVDQIRYQGNELVLTAFANVRDDVDAQCANIRRLKQQGDVGMVLFYVGILMPQVDPKLIALANELDYVLIQMPLNDMHAAYSDVISDVMQAIFIDQLHNPIFAIELLEAATKLPAPQHNVDTILRMLSERLHVSIALFDHDGQVLQASPWPSNANIDWQALGAAHQSHLPIAKPNTHYYWEAVDPALGSTEALIISDAHPVDVYTRSEIAATIQIALNLWTQPTATTNRSDLLEAIMADDPIRTQRLANLAHLDLTQLRHGWLLPGFQGPERLLHQAKLLKQISALTPVVLGETYDGMFYLFSNRHDADTQVAQVLADAVKTWHYPIPPVKLPVILDLQALRQAATLAQSAAVDATKIFPQRQVLTLGDLQLAQQCRNRVDAGQAALDTYLQRAKQQLAVVSEPEWLATAAVFLLDQDRKLANTAAQMFIHPNTVAYRLHQLSQKLGFTVGSMPDSWPLYELAGVMRLVSMPRA